MSRTRRTLLGLAGCVLVALFLPAAWWRGVLQAGSGLPDAPYRVVDTGYWPAQVNPRAEPLWLDTERLLFTSTATLRPGRSPHRVQVLNLATQQLTSTVLEDVIVECARAGQVVYAKKDYPNRRVTHYRGALGKAKEYPNPDGSASMNLADHTMQIDARFDCDWVPRKTAGYIPFPIGSKYKLLGENYLERVADNSALPQSEERARRSVNEQAAGHRASSSKVVYHQNADDPGREVPYAWWQYSEYLDAYVGSGFYDPANPKRRHFRILRRDGDLKEIPYPPALLIGRTDVYPVRVGYVVHYTGGSLMEKKHSQGLYKNSRGLYLIEGNQVSRLIVGYVEGVHVSPDGCKTAFSHADTLEIDLSLTQPHRTVKYIDFCEGGAP